MEGLVKDLVEKYETRYEEASSLFSMLIKPYTAEWAEEITEDNSELLSNYFKLENSVSGLVKELVSPWRAERPFEER